MDRIQQSLINRARKKYKTIFPCASKTNFSECFTAYQGKILFWFDTEEGSTHIITSNPRKKFARSRNETSSNLTAGKCT